MINESEYNQDLADFEQGSASDNEMVTKTKSTKPAEIAFTFPCPATHKAFLNILEEIHIEDHATVVQRIRALYHPKLHADNKAKLAVFSQIILDHVMHLADNHLNPFPAIERLAKQVQSMLTQFGDSIAENIQIHLKDMQARCSKAVHFPRPSDLVLLTLISAIYPTSDFSHIIVTPAMLVMAQYLNQIKWSNVMSMVSAMYTSTLLLQYIRLSKRIVPEALNFHSLILARFSSFPSGVLPWIEENGKLGQKPEVPRKLAFKDAFPIGHAKSKEELEASILNESLGQVTTYAALYSGQEAFIELFQPYHKMLISALEKPDFQTLLSAELKSKALETSSTLTRMLNFAKDSRKPLTLQHHKAIPIASYLPKFDDKYSVDKRFDKDHADSAKLRAEYRRERKATIRELRSIGRTENNMKLVEQKDKDKAYEELMKKARSKVPNDQ
ncbi:putative nucleolar complex protein 14 [Neolecta irregularis DAH-3]|uniref:Putative nucleolar complex protein 14 n=1 Tax=Neolecta irregularis (strain DAH-3) TaxID=1198029 RepID=A0A1U7LLN1_NEOID|nr:putative nucleolar complex protein 14 [Neolecta irregularis DAH-3]|eukprot:OLL23557.1 putative nucleolar complex protein 14 [Neolecta irregularis DAH-3]